MTQSPLHVLSPLDGRYQHQLNTMASLFSEASLMKHRLKVEIIWLKTLSSCPAIKAIPALSDDSVAQLDQLLHDFDDEAAQTIKKLELECNHDVKAVEYYLKNALQKISPNASWIEYVHFACTSEDINNIAYALMIQSALQTILLPSLTTIITTLTTQAHNYSDIAMLSRTHGQAASPTTLGKEIANIAYRLQRPITQLKQLPIAAKCNGAVGNYNAHQLAYPDVDWPTLTRTMIESMGLTVNPYTTQIEPHDWIAECAHILMRCHHILLDYTQDTWHYISRDYYQLHNKANEVGSSTMPHKINPIDFENAEGNFGMANSLLQFFANKLAISRGQRDLSDSTVMRNIGSALGYSQLAMQALLKGINKLSPRTDRLHHDLQQHWEVLAEAIQTLMRKEGIDRPYEQLKQFTRGKAVTADTLQQFIQQSELSDAAKKICVELTPEQYVGLASELATHLE